MSKSKNSWPREYNGALIFLIPYFTDWGSTALLFAVGGSEGNPVLRGVGLAGLLGLKLWFAPFLYTIAIMLLKIHRNAGRGFVALLYSYFGFLTVWNIYLVEGLV